MHLKTLGWAPSSDPVVGRSDQHAHGDSCDGPLARPTASAMSFDPVEICAVLAEEGVELVVLGADLKRG